MSEYLFCFNNFLHSYSKEFILLDHSMEEKGQDMAPSGGAKDSIQKRWQSKNLCES